MYDPSDGAEYDAHCPACGDPIQYCSGHGDIGDPYGAAILSAHDDGTHTGCHPAGCDDAPGADDDAPEPTPAPMWHAQCTLTRTRDGWTRSDARPTFSFQDNGYGVLSAESVACAIMGAEHGDRVSLALTAPDGTYSSTYGRMHRDGYGRLYMVSVDVNGRTL